MIPFRLIAAFWPALRGTVLRSRAFPGLLGGGGAAPGPLSEDPWPADPAVAHALLTGSVPVHGLALPAAEVWRASQEHAPATAAALHGFGWLDDLRAHATPEAADAARSLVAAWIDSQRAWRAEVWRAEVTGRRLGRWLAAAGFLDLGADDAFRKAFRRSLLAQARFLMLEARTTPTDSGAFQALKGRVYAAVALAPLRRDLNAALALLAQEADRQIRPDGGHMERCPATQLRVLQDLIDIRGALLGANMEPPPALQSGIDRMVPLLRCFRLGDGGLVQFNGGGEETRERIDSILARAGVKGRAVLTAPHSGFQRMAAGRTVVLVDGGAPPPSGADRHAHAGTLSFEMSVGRERLIVNCGSPGNEDAPLAAALRATAAHSTLIVDDTNSSRIAPHGGFDRRPGPVGCAREEADGATWLTLEHDGYAETAGLIHQRRLFLDAEGADFRGADRLVDAGLGVTGLGVTVRFHLHPSVRASVVKDRTSVLLRLKSGAVWRFAARGADITLEESLYAGDPQGRRRGEQIVLTTVRGVNGDDTLINWALRREDAPAAAAPKETAPMDRNKP